MVEPLPLVPATWMTGGSVPLRMTEPRRARAACARATGRCAWDAAPAAARGWNRQAAHAVIAQRSPLRGCAIAGNASAARRRAAAGSRFGDIAARAGALVSTRQSSASVGAQLVAMHHHVDHAVLLEIFGALEALGQLLADGLLDHARARKADQRARLGDMHVAEHRVGRGDAAGGRIGQHHDVGLACASRSISTATVVRGSCISDRMPSCMRAPPEAANMMKGVPLLDRGFQPLDHRLARRHAERAAHEIEILHADRRPASRRACRSRA